MDLCGINGRRVTDGLWASVRRRARMLERSQGTNRLSGFFLPQGEGNFHEGLPFVVFN